MNEYLVTTWTNSVLASVSGTPDCLVRSLLAEQALVSVAAAMALPEAWS